MKVIGKSLPDHTALSVKGKCKRFVSRRQIQRAIRHPQQLRVFNRTFDKNKICEGIGNEFDCP